MRNTSLKSVYQLALQDPRVVYIGSDLGAGVLDEMKQNIPDRFIWKGERAAYHWYVCGNGNGRLYSLCEYYCYFLTRRCFEQVAIDLCLHDLPVRLIANGGELFTLLLGLHILLLRISQFCVLYQI